MQKSTIDWDDLRLFLGLVRHGSARGAAQALALSHSTVVRRVERLESDLGVRLFDRDFTGYRPTAAGETLLVSALKAEDAILAAGRKLHGQDARLTGEIRLTTSDILVNYLLMPDLALFTSNYPDIDLTVLQSYDIFDLARREADVAIRFIGGGRSPPEDLVGRKLVAAASCYYATERYLEDHFLDDDARLVLAANYLFGGRPAASVDLLESAFSQEVVKSPAGQVVLAAAQKIQYGEPVGK